MERRQKYLVKYCVNYPSGKIWKSEQEVYAITEYGAIQIIKWLKSKYNISILSIVSNGYVGSPINSDRSTLGDF